MRTIATALTTAQKSLNSKPTWALVIGSTTLTSYLMGYSYTEALNQAQTLTLTLNNASGYFNTNAPAQGATVELKRGIGSNLAELPRFWVESISYNYQGHRSTCVVRCIDWWGELAATSPAADQAWVATSSTTILEWILAQVGLTRLAGTMTDPTLTFTARKTETLSAALQRLLQKIPEYLYAGLDGEIKWKTIPSDEASVYTFGWNAEHKLIKITAGSAAYRYNSVTVYNATYTGTATNAAQIALNGTRAITYLDNTLTSDAQCASAATHYLNLFAANATQAQISCRPVHGLELLDVVKLDNPPWGGADVTGRVVRISESRVGGIATANITLGAR